MHLRKNVSVLPYLEPMSINELYLKRFPDLESLETSERSSGLSSQSFELQTRLFGYYLYKAYVNKALNDLNNPNGTARNEVPETDEISMVDNQEID